MFGIIKCMVVIRNETWTWIYFSSLALWWNFTLQLFITFFKCWVLKKKMSLPGIFFLKELLWRRSKLLKISLHKRSRKIFFSKSQISYLTKTTSYFWPVTVSLFFRTLFYVSELTLKCIRRVWIDNRKIFRYSRS